MHTVLYLHPNKPIIAKINTIEYDTLLQKGYFNIFMGSKKLCITFIEDNFYDFQDIEP